MHKAGKQRHDACMFAKGSLGVAIVSTSHGVMTSKQAKAEKVGGEVLCYVY